MRTRLPEFRRAQSLAYPVAVLEWQAQVLGPTDNRFVIVDGKKLRHGGREIVNAVDGAGRFLGVGVTPATTNEIPAARQPSNYAGKKMAIWGPSCSGVKGCTATRRE